MCCFQPLSFHLMFLFKTFALMKYQNFQKEIPTMRMMVTLTSKLRKLILRILISSYPDANPFNLNLSLTLRSTFCMVKLQYIVFLALNFLLLVSIMINVSTHWFPWKLLYLLLPCCL
jgi:hypothetical protein